MYNRRELKRQTKSMVVQGNPATWKVLLVYLLATIWVSNVLGLIVANPFSRATDVVNQWTDAIAADPTMMSQAGMDLLTRQIWSCFSGTSAMIGLLVMLLVVFYTFVVDLGLSGYCLRRMRGEDAKVSDLFANFDIAGKVILMEILRIIFIGLWSMLFVIPGIIAAYRYSMAAYALWDDPNISPLEAIRRSKRLMKGRKGALFVTELSFLGWSLLAGLAVEIVYGIGSWGALNDAVSTVLYLVVYTAVNMFLLSYTRLTYAGFYLNALNQDAPPVQGGDGFDRFEARDPWNNPEDEGWNR